MKVYFGFDDTDSHDSLYGTGKLVRWFQDALPEGCECIGVVRRQLLVCDDIPYTSHNSSACLIADMPEPDFLNRAIDKAVNHPQEKGCWRNIYWKRRKETATPEPKEVAGQ